MSILKNRLAFLLFFIIIFASVSCQKDVEQSESHETSELSQKEIEIKWAESRSGRWLSYAIINTLKQAEKQEISKSQYNSSLLNVSENAIEHYKNLLVEKYGQHLPKNINTYLDSIYPEIYFEMDKKMSNPKYMEKLFLDYKQLNSLPLKKRKNIVKKSSNIIDDIVFKQCGFSSSYYSLELLILAYMNENNQNIFNCTLEAKGKLATWESKLYRSGHNYDCQSLDNELFTIYQNLMYCINSNVGGGYEDPFPPGGGNNNGNNSGSHNLDLSELDADSKGKIVEAIEEIERNCAYKTLLSNTLTYDKIKVTINNSLEAEAVYVPNIKEIQYKSTQYLDIFSYLIHEMFHSYQHHNIGPSFSNYGKLPGNTASPGFINIEFEQVVFQDIIERVRSGTTNTGSMFKQYHLPGYNTAFQAYQDWISLLTNNGTTYPDLANNASFETQYFNQLNSFSIYGHSDYIISTIIPTLKPLTLKKLFDGNKIQANCNK